MEYDVTFLTFRKLFCCVVMPHLIENNCRLDVIKVLLSKCDLNILDGNGNTLLHIACKHGDRATVEALVAYQRCQLNIQN